MKVQLVVVRGKPEGKVIPLVGPSFKIGRGETCHLRPNSEQVSREHAEFTIVGELINVRDLGSRNGTLVNGKALTTEACQLKDRDLVQVGPLTFAVSILDAAPSTGKTPSPSRAAAKAIAGRRQHRRHRFVVGRPELAVIRRSADRRLRRRHDHDQRLQRRRSCSAQAGNARRRPATTNTSDSPTIEPKESDEPFDDEEDDDETIDEECARRSPKSPRNSWTNPTRSTPPKRPSSFRPSKAPAGPSKASFKDTSDAAGDILRRLMERRRAEKVVLTARLDPAESTSVPMRRRFDRCINRARSDFRLVRRSVAQGRRGIPI